MLPLLLFVRSSSGFPLAKVGLALETGAVAVTQKPLGEPPVPPKLERWMGEVGQEPPSSRLARLFFSVRWRYRDMRLRRYGRFLVWWD